MPYVKDITNSSYTTISKNTLLNLQNCIYMSIINSEKTTLTLTTYVI